MQIKTRRPAIQRAAKLADRVIATGERARKAVRGYAVIDRFGSVGTGFRFDPHGTYSYGSIHVGDFVNLGTSPVMLATKSSIRIGNHVMFGPSVTVRGGNHRIDLVGRYMDTVGDDEKLPENDPGVVIEDDVWVGGNATILGGVTVGRGSVIAACAVVTRDVPPYSIVGGNPAKVIRQRFTADDVAKHESLLAGGGPDRITGV